MQPCSFLRTKSRARSSNSSTSTPTSWKVVKPGRCRGIARAVVFLQVYLTTLEATKSWSLDTAARLAPSEAGQAGLSNLFAGATASLVTQSVIVPIDVISQRLMVAGEDPVEVPCNSNVLMLHMCRLN